MWHGRDEGHDSTWYTYNIPFQLPSKRPILKYHRWNSPHCRTLWKPENWGRVKALIIRKHFMYIKTHTFPHICYARHVPFAKFLVKGSSTIEHCAAPCKNVGRNRKVRRSDKDVKIVAAAWRQNAGASSSMTTKCWCQRQQQHGTRVETATQHSSNAVDIVKQAR